MNIYSKTPNLQQINKAEIILCKCNKQKSMNTFPFEEKTMDPYERNVTPNHPYTKKVPILTD